ncbi:MAG: YhcG family protein [Crocinitomicaceae bacterium]|jgi:predicted nuclease of restriction endonuclease-like (RecB) superfamily
MISNYNSTTNEYHGLVEHISDTYNRGFQKASQAINSAMVTTYWKIGQYIIEFEQKGNEKAKYGTSLLEKLSIDLMQLHGKGFSRSNLNYMRLFYKCYPICETVSHKLNWSHICELVKINDQLERSFYEKQTILENWNVRELKRQKKSSLFLRLASTKDKEGILSLSEHGNQIQHPTDILRDPCVLEFLKIPEAAYLSESEIETKLIDHLEHFLLELGKGFAFIGRQYRISIGNRNFYVDLVFYHRILKCFVLIDLKREEAGYEDIGQMNMYLGYFEKEENREDDNPPIGIVLAKEKDDLLIQYAMHNMTSQLFINKYQLYLPNEEELRKIIENQLNTIKP